MIFKLYALLNFKPLIINTEYLKKISNNDYKFLIKIYNAYEFQIKEIFNDIYENLDNNNVIQVSKLYHKLKSSFNVLGISKFKNEIVMIENLSNHNLNSEEIYVITKKIENITSLVTEEMINFIENLKKETC